MVLLVLARDIGRYCFLPSQTTPVKQSTGGLCQAEHLYGEVHVCVGFPGRRNVSPFLRLKQYVALGDTVKELLFSRKVWRFMIPGKGIPCFLVFEDDRGALQFSINLVLNSNSKYIDVHHHFLRELVRQGDISVNNVLSEYQYADVLTKGLAFDLFATTDVSW